MHYSLYDTLI